MLASMHFDLDTRHVWNIAHMPWLPHLLFSFTFTHHDVAGTHCFAYCLPHFNCLPGWSAIKWWIYNCPADCRSPYFAMLYHYLMLHSCILSTCQLFTMLLPTLLCYYLSCHPYYRAPDNNAMYLAGHVEFMSSMTTSNIVCLCSMMDH